MNVLCSFANSLFENGFPRLKSQADEMCVFEKVYFYTEKNLDSDFKKHFKKHLIPYSKGYGYWCWKPQVILQTLNKINDGDILLYMDLGSHLNVNGRKRLLEYIELVKADQTGILAFQSPTYVENSLTKMDVFDYFGVREDKRFTDTTQIEATHIIIRKCDKSVEFVTKWIKVIYDDFSLITDSKSRNANFDTFYAHRHDQSIFSILAKKYNIQTLSINETYSLDWDTMKNYPVLAKRDKVLKNSFQRRYYSKIGKFYRVIWKIIKR